MERAEDLVTYAKEILSKYGDYKNPTKIYFQCQIIPCIQTFNSSLPQTNTFTVSSKI